MGVGASVALKLRLSKVGYWLGLSTWCVAGLRADLSAHRRQWSSLFLALMTTFLVCTSLGSGM